VWLCIIVSIVIAIIPDLILKVAENTFQRINEEKQEKSAEKVKSLQGSNQSR
jgi:hypothetical protein